MGFKYNDNGSCKLQSFITHQAYPRFEIKLEKLKTYGQGNIFEKLKIFVTQSSQKPCTRMVTVETKIDNCGNHN